VQHVDSQSGSGNTPECFFLAVTHVDASDSKAGFLFSAVKACDNINLLSTFGWQVSHAIFQLSQ